MPIGPSAVDEATRGLISRFVQRGVRSLLGGLPLGWLMLRALNVVADKLKHNIGLGVCHGLEQKLGLGVLLIKAKG